MAKGLMLLPMLATACLLAGCASSGTLTTEIERRLVADTCQRAWRPISYSAKRDTPETVLEVRAGNAARAAYCGENR